MARASGDDRDRTGNLRLAKPALSRLSYVPEPTEIYHLPLTIDYYQLGSRRGESRNRNSQIRNRKSQVGPGRLELPTSRLSGVRSNQLSYEPLHPISASRPNRLSLNWCDCRYIAIHLKKSNKKNRCFSLPAVGGLHAGFPISS